MVRTKKEIAKSVKSLIVMLQSIRDQQVTVTLRNDTIVRGIIIDVDSNMNIELKNAIVEPDMFYCTSSTPGEEEEDEEEQQNVVVSSNDDQECRLNVDETTDAVVDDCEENGGLIGENDAGVEQNSGKLDYFVVKGTRIRHIDLPADTDLVASAKGEIERIRNRRKQWTKRDIVRSAQ